MCVCVTDQRPSDHSQAGCTCRTCLNFIMKHSNRQIYGWMDGRTDGQSLELEDLYTNIYRLIYRFRFFVYCVLHMYDIYLHLYGSCQPFKVHCGSLSKSDQSQSTNLPA